MQRSLRNVDYLQKGISNNILEEISYKFEVININKDDYLFQVGSPCKNLYIIAQGEIDIYVSNSSREAYLDTLYTGCTIGSYGCTTQDCYNTSGKAKTDCVVLKLHCNKLIELRQEHPELDDIMTQYEAFIETNGSPF